MRVRDTAEEARFREEARDWLESNVPREPRPPHDLAAQRDFDVAWRRRQFDGGWGHIAWPVEHGGRGLPLAQQMIWMEECARAGAPDHIDMFFVALQHAGPTLIACADAAQQAAYLRPILTGETIWCQGFSEPGAGSDLAALRTRGEVDGDHLVINGQKIWTSFGRFARFQELLVRTEPGSTRHRGISFVICDMTLPGIDIRPIRNLAGGDDFCEVFYDNGRGPLDQGAGGLGNGWQVAMSTLAFERGAASIPGVLEVNRAVEQLIDEARARGAGHLLDALARARADAMTLRAMVHRVVARNRGGSEGSMVRLRLSELAQRVSGLAMDLLGAEALDRSAMAGWPRRHLIDLKHTIAGGTSEIQRNILGERVFGLPREGKRT
ncbi:MAG TPA: acyl-CoA dehydrogenase family protein [Novosphingobium sp.]|nr:acyl-CoA dehydrogenase family protein [Novosphingobium sp.]